MSKDVLINFRISEKDREIAKDLVKKLGYKNLSSFLREYLEELSSLYNHKSKELDLLEEFYKSKLEDLRNPREKFVINNRLNLIKEFKQLLESDDLQIKE